MADSPPEVPSKNPPIVDISGKIMVAAIIALFIVIVFVLFLHLYARWLWSRRADGTSRHPSRQRRRFVFAPAQDVLALRNRLEPSVLRSLPVVAFHAVDEFKDGLECAVCLSELTEGEKVRLLPKCNHGFHVECIDMWFQSHSTCPLCRNPVGAESADSSPTTHEGIQSSEENSTSGYSIESLNFPTNVLFWGNQGQVSAGAAGLEQVSSSSTTSSSSSSPPNFSPDSSLAIEIPSRSNFEELKTPTPNRLRSLRRLLSREKRVISPSGGPSSVDVELGEVGRDQSSKTSSDS